jgi:diaminohydroxyphosphoribosylaminopyrimidine deaminase/5-amino-6-(5-phosphoribosylamino)uracil reductase
LVAAIWAAASPEEAAALGRRSQRERPHLLRPDWGAAKQAVMAEALRAKFGAHAGPRAMLLATRGAELVEASPHDAYWGQGFQGEGRNMLGRLLEEVRAELEQARGGTARGLPVQALAGVASCAEVGGEGPQPLPACGR